jgi:hypothetical protein
VTYRDRNSKSGNERVAARTSELGIRLALGVQSHTSCGDIREGFARRLLSLDWQISEAGVRGHQFLKISVPSIA